MSFNLLDLHQSTSLQWQIIKLKLLWKFQSWMLLVYILQFCGNVIMLLQGLELQFFLLNFILIILIKSLQQHKDWRVHQSRLSHCALFTRCVLLNLLISLKLSPFTMDKSLTIRDFLHLLCCIITSHSFSRCRCPLP